MRVNILNLPHRKDRLESCLNQFKEQGITDYKIWPGIIHPMVFTGISKAHKQIVRDAKDNKEPMVCICEDDICFSSPGSFNFFLENIPQYFDLYLSSIYWGNILEDNTVKEFSSLTLYIVHERFYDTFLSTNEGNHIDRQMKVHGGRYVVCNPFVSKQFDGYSDNAGRVVKYEKRYLSGRKFFTLQTH